MPTVVRNSRPSGPCGWPSYQGCLEHLKNEKRDGQHDRGKADFAFCILAIDWGRGIDDTADRLMQESDKAQENGHGYALCTARMETDAVERRGR